MRKTVRIAFTVGLGVAFSVVAAIPGGGALLPPGLISAVCATPFVDPDRCPAELAGPASPVVNGAVVGARSGSAR